MPDEAAVFYGSTTISDRVDHRNGMASVGDLIEEFEVILSVFSRQTSDGPAV